MAADRTQAYGTRSLVRVDDNIIRHTPQPSSWHFCISVGKFSNSLFQLHGQGPIFSGLDDFIFARCTSSWWFNLCNLLLKHRPNPEEPCNSLKRMLKVGPTVSQVCRWFQYCFCSCGIVFRFRFPVTFVVCITTTLLKSFKYHGCCNRTVVCCLNHCTNRAP